jgi:hypothetical protein
VELNTTNALTWVTSGGDNGACDFATDPLLFGHRAPDVLNEEDPALGKSSFELVFINTAPGATLLDLIQLLVEGPEDVISIEFGAEAKGPLEDGTLGEATVKQVCPAPCATNFTFSVETIDIKAD